MRTAIFLLLGILIIVLIGSFVPQQNTSDPGKVEAFLTAWPNLNLLFADLQLPLTQVFVSPVFYVLLGLLYVSLGWRVIRRGRALIMRTARGYKRTPQYWGEWGSWLFHSSFFLLLIAVVWGKATGYQGLVTLTQGQSFTNTPAGYDTLQEGLLFHGNYAPFTLRLNKFEATYAPNGEASNYVSNVTVLDHGKKRGDQGHPRQRVPQRRRRQCLPAGLRLGADDRREEPRRADRVRRMPSSSSTTRTTSATRRWRMGSSRSPTSTTRSPGPSEAVQIGAKMSFFPDATVIPSVGSQRIHQSDSHPVRAGRRGAAQPGHRDAALRRQPRAGQRRSAERESAQHHGDEPVFHQRTGDPDHARPDPAAADRHARTARPSISRSPSLRSRSTRSSRSTTTRACCSSTPRSS